MIHLCLQVNKFKGGKTRYVNQLEVREMRTGERANEGRILREMRSQAGREATGLLELILRSLRVLNYPERLLFHFWADTGPLALYLTGPYEPEPQAKLSRISASSLGLYKGTW